MRRCWSYNCFPDSSLNTSHFVRCNLYHHGVTAFYLSHAKSTLMHKARDAFPAGMHKPLLWVEITRFLSCGLPRTIASTFPRLVKSVRRDPRRCYKSFIRSKRHEARCLAFRFAITIFIYIYKDIMMIMMMIVMKRWNRIDVQKYCFYGNTR